MIITVLDGYTLNPGDLSWEQLKKLGDVTVYDRTPTHLILERSADSEIILTNKTPLKAETLSFLPKLKYIGVLATGYNIVDTQAAKKRGIIVTNVPSYGTNSVAQMTFALLLALCNRAEKHSAAVFNGEWSKCLDFCFWNNSLVELSGKTMGIIGFGRIGRQVASISYAFGMNVLGYSPNTAEYVHEKFKWSQLDELFEKSDVVSLHCPLFPETRGIINKYAISKMKQSAFIINTSRGPLINETDLAYALNNNLISGAAVDVLSTEPPRSDNPLLKAKNCIITPHIAWATNEARARLMDIAVSNVESFINGNTQNEV